MALPVPRKQLFIDIQEVNPSTVGSLDTFSALSLLCPLGVPGESLPLLCKHEHLEPTEVWLETLHACVLPKR